MRLNRKKKLCENNSPIPKKSIRKSFDLSSLKQRKKYSEDADKILTTNHFVIIQVKFSKKLV